MKKVLLAIAAVATITSCSQNEEFENPTQKAEINFTPIVKNSTRAAIMDPTLLQTEGFKAYAYNVGEQGIGSLEKPILGSTGVDVTYDLNAWKYTGTYYWPSNAKVKFFAYAPANSTAEYSITVPSTDTAPKITYTVPDVDKQEDLVVAKTEALVYADAGVILPFTHVLTQVNFSIKGQDALTYILTSLKITGVANTGTYNWNDSWNVSGTAGEYVYPIGGASVEIANSETKDLMQSNGALMLLPQKFEKPSLAKIVVDYTVLDANKDLVYTATGKEVSLAESTAWEIGKKVRYILTLTNDAKQISFGTPTVSHWNTNDDEEVEK